MSLPTPITRKESYLAAIAGEQVQVPEKPITREEAYLDAIAKGGGGGEIIVDPVPTQGSTNAVSSGGTYTALQGKLDASEKGTASGVAELDANGKVLSSQLPSFVDDVVEGYYDSETDRFYEESTFENVIDPVEGKSWIDIPANKSYRWTGTVYVRVDEGVQIGDTSNSAFRGDWGKALKDTMGTGTLDTEAQTVIGAVNELKGAMPTDLADLEGDSTHRTVTDTEKAEWSGKQDSLTFDTTPTEDSENPVTSGGVHEAIKNAVSGKIYGFRIVDAESNPSSKIIYLADAVGMTPAYMDYANDSFNYGSWANAFFMPKPCMVKYDGTRDYYLDPNDYSKKADGTASDIDDATYAGNAMMEFPKIWQKIVPTADGKGADVYLANYKADENYTCFPYIAYDGTEKDHFYTAIYNSKEIDGKARSLSGQTGVMKSKTAQDERDAILANNVGTGRHWDMESYAERVLITFLMMLISKTTDSQTAFGQGLTTSSSEAALSAFETGVHNTKGLFYGTNASAADVYTNAVKIFGIENYQVFQWRRLLGVVIDSGLIKTKLCYGTADGSTTADFNFTGDDYVSGDSLVTLGDSNGWCNVLNLSARGFIPYHAATPTASASTYYCDSHFVNLSGAKIPLVGGPSGNAAECGAFYWFMFYAKESTGWNIGAALSCK